MTEKRKPLAAAEASLRRVLLMVGFGVLSYIGGTILVSDLVARMASRLETHAPNFIFMALVYCGWALIVLPAIAYFAARFMELSPWATGVIGVLSGATFQFMLAYVTKGDQVFEAYGSQLWVWALALVGAAVITARAVHQARVSAGEAEALAQRQAEAKKTQYDEFVKQSEALAERREQVPIAAAPPAPAEAVPAAPTVEATDPKP